MHGDSNGPQQDDGGEAAGSPPSSNWDASLAAEEVLLVSAEAQTGLQFIDTAVQCEPPTVDADELRRLALAPELANFLSSATPLCEEALQQNELVDVMADELDGLVDDEGAADGPAGATNGSGHGASAGGRSAAVGLVEHQSFSDLLHSKGKVLVAAQWHPVRRGVAAVACIHPPQPQPAQQAGVGAASQAGAQQPHLQVQHAHAQAGAAASSSTPFMLQPPQGSILVWSQADCVHPESVLQAPAEVLALAYHPSQPHWLAAGLITGQVALFNLQQAVPGAAPGAPVSSAQAQQSRVGLAGEADAREDGCRPAALLPTHVSLPEASHKSGVTDMQWLPGTLVSREGKLEAAAGAAAVKEASSLSAATTTASAPAAAPDACTLFASTAADGSLLVWDMRINTRQRKPAAVKDDEQPEWKPVLGLAASSTCKQPMPATRFCPDPRSGPARFVLGSLEGELAVVDGGAACTEHRGSSHWAHNTVQHVRGHTGRVAALAFSPFFPDLLLVVADSGFTLWRVPEVLDGGAVQGTPHGDGSSSSGGKTARRGSCAVADKEGEGGGMGGCLPLYCSPFSPALYTCGCWSPSKPGTIILGRQDGLLEAWDLLDRTHQPAVVAPVSPCALTSLVVSPQPAAGAGSSSSSSKAPPPQLLAVGDCAGTLRLLELPRPLRRRGRVEVKAMAALLQREEERLRAVTARAAVRLAEQKAAAEHERAMAAAAAQHAARSQQQQDAAAAGRKEVQGAAVEKSAEEVYLAYEAEWRAKLVLGEQAAVGEVGGP